MEMDVAPGGGSDRPCPSPEALRRRADWPEVAEGFRSIEAHVQGCPHCQGVIERMASGDSSRTGIAGGPGRWADLPPALPGFVFERELGRGGMGVVFSAWQPQLARRVAVKVVGKGVAEAAEDRRRWLREARAVGQIRHPNVVRLYEAGEHDGCLFLVLELVDGGSLADRLRGPLPAREAARLMATVARAIDEVHRQGVLHLDIKPSNILLDGPPDGAPGRATPMLADFGIARRGRAGGGDTASGQLGIRGTPSFMAPEQIAGDGDAIGPRSDVYALGATLYWLLTGRPPFQGASAIETLDLVRTQGPRRCGRSYPACRRTWKRSSSPACAEGAASPLRDGRARWPTTWNAGSAATLIRSGGRPRRRNAWAVAAGGRGSRRSRAVLACTIVGSFAGLVAVSRQAEANRIRAENALARARADEEASEGHRRSAGHGDGLGRFAPDARVGAAEKSAEAARDLAEKPGRPRHREEPRGDLRPGAATGPRFRVLQQPAEARGLLEDGLTCSNGGARRGGLRDRRALRGRAHRPGVDRAPPGPRRSG
ncbi:MAG: protein kinase [Isosphaeraceae bacterium]